MRISIPSRCAKRDVEKSHIFELQVETLYVEPQKLPGGPSPGLHMLPLKIENVRKGRLAVSKREQSSSSIPVSCILAWVTSARVQHDEHDPERRLFISRAYPSRLRDINDRRFESGVLGEARATLEGLTVESRCRFHPRRVNGKPEPLLQVSLKKFHSDPTCWSYSFDLQRKTSPDTFTIDRAAAAHVPQAGVRCGRSAPRPTSRPRARALRRGRGPLRRRRPSRRHGEARHRPASTRH